MADRPLYLSLTEARNLLEGRKNFLVTPQVDLPKGTVIQISRKSFLVERISGGPTEVLIPPLGIAGDTVYLAETFAEVDGKVIFKNDFPGNAFPAENRTWKWKSPALMFKGKSRFVRKISEVLLVRPGQIPQDIMAQEFPNAAWSSYESLWKSKYGYASWDMFCYVTILK